MLFGMKYISLYFIRVTNYNSKVKRRDAGGYHWTKASSREQVVELTLQLKTIAFTELFLFLISGLSGLRINGIPLSERNNL